MNIYPTRGNAELARDTTNKNHSNKIMLEDGWNVRS